MHQMFNFTMKFGTEFYDSVEQSHSATVTWLCTVRMIIKAYLANSHKSTHDKEKWQA